jgi:carbamate kinase
MKKERFVVALGGNALGNNLQEQKVAVRGAAQAIANLIEAGHEVVIAHGNGPQVGALALALEAAGKTEAKTEHFPLNVCIAMTQGYIGADLQNTLREELLGRGIDKPVVTIVTQTLVDGSDPAFQNPTKPIGAFYTEEEARAIEAEGTPMKEDAGRGYRRVVASPKPIGIVEKDTVEALLKAGQVPIAVGGGGVPVKETEGNHLEGVPAVVDKDFASAKLAEMINADALVILTAVEKAMLNFRTPEEQGLDQLTPEEAAKYIAEGHFAPGSMLPKMEASLLFAKSAPGRRALITLLSKAKDGIEGKTGTTIVG